MNRKSKVAVFKKKPSDFTPKVEVAAIYLECEGTLLLLERASICKSEPNTWTVPAGKLELAETALDAAKRELLEETGIVENREDRWKYRGALYIRKPEFDYVYHLFEVHLDETPAVRLSPREHQDFRWVAFSEIENMNLITGAKEVLAQRMLTMSEANS